MPRLSLRLPEELQSRLAEEARRDGLARSEVARTAYADPIIRKDALALAKEGLMLGGEG